MPVQRHSETFKSRVFEYLDLVKYAKKREKKNKKTDAINAYTQAVELLDNIIHFHCTLKSTQEGFIQVNLALMEKISVLKNEVEAEKKEHMRLIDEEQKQHEKILQSNSHESDVKEDLDPSSKNHFLYIINNETRLK
jgi:hypothetical protein